MTKIWYFSRVLAISLTLYCLLGLGTGSLQQPVTAEEACDTAVTCVGRPGSCSCADNGGTCTGCYVPNNQKSCGGCSGGALTLE
jgi:hypothetical protein